MTRVKGLIGIFAFSLIVLALPSAASAQWRDRNRNNDYYGNQGYYGNIRQNIRNIENRSETFERLADRRNDRRNRAASNNLENLASEFRRAIQNLGDEYGNGRNINNSRDEARRVLNLASQIDQQMYRSRGNNQLAYEWREIHNDLDVIAAAYGFNNNRRNNRRGGWGF